MWPSVTLQLFEMILLFVKFVIYFLLKLLPDFSIMSIMFKLLIDFTIMCIMCTQCEQAKGNVLYEGYRPINFLCPVSYAPQCTGLPGTRGVYPLLGHDLPVLLSSVPRFDPQVSPSTTPPVENSKRSDAQAWCGEGRITPFGKAGTCVWRITSFMLYYPPLASVTWEGHVHSRLSPLSHWTLCCSMWI